MYTLLWNTFVLFAAVHGSTVEDINKLLQNKTTIVNKQIRPAFNQSNAIEVKFSYELMSIYNFDEVAQKITTVGYFHLWWKDELMAWNPEDYNGLDQIEITGAITWTPVFVLSNPSGKSEPLIADWQVLRYHKTGWCLISPIAVYESTCSVDVTRYPWDEQVCDLYFVPWGYLRYEVLLIADRHKVGTTFYAKNGEWDLVDSASVSYVNDVEASVAMIRLRLKRRPLFCIVNAILPVVFMSFLNVFVFMIPVKTGERFSFCITVLLSIAVFLTLIADSLPRISDPMSVFSYYLVTVLSVSVFIVLANIVSASLFLTEAHIPVPQSWVVFVHPTRCLHKLRMCLVTRGYNHDSGADKEKYSKRDKTQSFIYKFGSLCFRKCPQKKTSVLDIHKQSMEDKFDHTGLYCTEQNDSLASTCSGSDTNEDPDQRTTWEDVSKAFDKVCFLFFMICLAVISIGFVVSII